MDPVEKTLKPLNNTITLGDLITYYYDKFSEIYDNPELCNLAVTTVIDDILSRSSDE